MEKKILSTLGANKTNINVKLDGCIPLGIMSTEQYERYKRFEDVVDDVTTDVIYKEENETLTILHTFLHPVTKAKFNLVYNGIKEELILLPDISLNIDLGIQNINVIGYAIGGASIENKVENFNFKKSIDTTFKIKLDKTKLDNLKTKIKTAILAIHGADAGSSSSRGYGHYAANGDYMEYHTFPQAMLIIDFTDEILNETLPVNVLTTYNITDDKIISNNYVLKENIQKHLVFLSL